MAHEKPLRGRRARRTLGRDARRSFGVPRRARRAGRSLASEPRPGFPGMPGDAGFLCRRDRSGDPAWVPRSPASSSGDTKGASPAIAPGCRGLVLPIFAEGTGFRVLSCSQVDLARAVLRALEGGAKVINISGGQAVPPGGAHPLLADAFRLCSGSRRPRRRGGRERRLRLPSLLPAALPNVLTVGALDRSGRPLTSSNWGTSYRSHGIMAPGEALPGARPGGGMEPCSGTSFAAALVSGIVAAPGQRAGQARSTRRPSRRRRLAARDRPRL